MPTSMLNSASGTEAEQVVIGAVLLDNSLLDKLFDLDPQDFFQPTHTILWQAFQALHEAGSSIDAVSLVDYLNQIGELQRIGGAAYLHTCIAAVPMTAHADYYAQQIREAANRRRIRLLGERLTQLSESDQDSSELLQLSREWLNATTGAEPAWPEPMPLGGRGHNLPVFPVQSLPSWLSEQVVAVAEFTQTPVDLPASIALAALSTAAAGRAVVDVRGSWREPVNVYTVVVLPPGSRKSAVFTAMTAPLLEAEKELIRVSGPAIAEAKLAREVTVKAAERAKSAAINCTDETVRIGLLAEANAATMNVEAVTVPPKPRLIADDVTPEAAASLLAEQGGRLAVLSAEGGIFATLAGRYSGVPNLEVFLKAHAADMLRVDRKHADPEIIEHPALTLGLAIQPEVLRDIATMPGFRGRGLLARILFALPENTVGRRKIGAPSIPSQVEETYRQHITRLVMTFADRTDPSVLTLTPGAQQALLALEAAVEPKLGPEGTWHPITDWGSKYCGAVIRIAGLLHLAENPGNGWTTPISDTTLKNAVLIGEYYATHAIAAFTDMGTDPTTEDARHILNWIQRKPRQRFTSRELFSELTRSRFPKTSRLDAPLRLLEEHGYIRKLPDLNRKRSGGRPSSPNWLVHPAYQRREAQG
jgi:replicative DNA helicase